MEKLENTHIPHLHHGRHLRVGKLLLEKTERYVARRAIAQGEAYNQLLAERFEREARTLSRLTGAPIQPIRQRISDEVPQPTPSRWLVMHPRSEAGAASPRTLGWGR